MAGEARIYFFFYLIISNKYLSSSDRRAVSDLDSCVSQRLISPLAECILISPFELLCLLYKFVFVEW